MKMVAKLIELTDTAYEKCPISCRVTPMGKDVQIAVWGGEQPHIGSTVIAQARPSLTGEGISVTSSVWNAIGHKDEVVARKCAEAMAIHGNCTAVCSCGIHMDCVTSEQLVKIQDCCDRMIRRCLVMMA